MEALFDFEQFCCDSRESKMKEKGSETVPLDCGLKHKYYVKKILLK